MTTESAKRRSFGKSIFGGKIESEVIIPYPEADPEESENVELLLDSLRKFASAEIDPAKIDREKKVPESVIRGLGDLGVLGLSIGEEHGGFGFSRTAYARVLEELGGLCASTAVTVGAHQSIGLKAILLFGTDEQKEMFLPTLATGEVLGGFALTEPNSGSDAGGIESTAVRSEDGTTFALNGRKQWITNGGIGGLFTVFVKTRPEGAEEKKVSAFVVTSDLAGVSHGPEADKLGILGSSTTDLILENVSLPAENLLGEEGRGFKIAMEVLNEGRLGLAAGSLGGMKTIIREALEYAKGRKQFGQSIFGFELIREKLARMAEDAYALESMVYLTTRLVDRGGVDFSLESAACKIFGSDALWRCASEALQIAGGYGYIREFPFERHLRDARINLIFEGTNEVLKLFIALAGLQGPGETLKEVAQALKKPLVSIGFLSDYAIGVIRQSIAGDSFTGASDALGAESLILSDRIHDLARASGSILRKHGKKVIERQYLLHRIADSFISIYAMAATISRTDRAIREKGAAAAESEIAFCQSFCSRVGQGAARRIGEIDQNDDELTDAIADTLDRRDAYPF
ncbi:MAG: acyl-CoA dehydrogenase family protein [Planctomycetota bacterium]|nr:acyl-CoA dehydrogenase family protein [Planctomycetota bacterium]